MNFNRLKDLREDRDMYQREVAEKIGVSRSTYNGWENGIDPIPLPRFNDICNFFQVSMDYVSGLSNVKNKRIINTTLNKIEIGKRLKEIRKEAHDIQEDVSKIIGLERSAYAKAERGNNFLLTALIITFCKYYNVSMDYICCRSNDKKLKQ